MSITGQLARMARPVVERFPKAARAYRYARDSMESHDEPRETSMGFRLAGSTAMQEGRFEPEETALVERLLGKVDVLVNVGANIGYYCCHALRRGKHVVAFEPIHSNLQLLYRNMKANHWENQIEVFPLALSDKAGLIEIYGGGTAASLVRGWAGTPDHYVTLVPTSTLDLVLGSRFHGQRSLVLVDIEGAERQMLQGAENMLARAPKPLWMVEIQVSEHQPKGTVINPNLVSTFQLFWDHGYEAWTANQQPRRIGPGDVESTARSGRDALLTHNFLFLEAGQGMEVLRS